MSIISIYSSKCVNRDCNSHNKYFLTTVEKIKVRCVAGFETLNHVIKYMDFGQLTTDPGWYHCSSTIFISIPGK